MGGSSEPRRCDEMRTRASAGPLTVRVLVVVAIEVEIQPGARADFEQRQRPSTGAPRRQRKCGEEISAAPYFVGLGAASGDEAGELVVVPAAELAKGRVRVVGRKGRRRDAGVVAAEGVIDSFEQQVMHRGEQQVGALLGARSMHQQPRGMRVRGYGAREMEVQRRGITRFVVSEAGEECLQPFGRAVVGRRSGHAGPKG